MSTPRRRRWIEVLRRTAGVAGDDGGRTQSGALDDAALWAVHERASASLKESSARAERVAATITRQRAHIEAAAERASLVAARSEGLGPGAARVAEAFERMGVVALNAGLEGARAGEARGQIERSRAEVSEVGQEAAQLQAAALAASRALDDLGARLRKATGIDPE